MSINIEIIEVSQVSKKSIGRPKITDQALRKTPLVRTKTLGRPKKYNNVEESLNALKQRYKDRHAYQHKLNYLLKNYSELVPEELLELPKETDADMRLKYYRVKQHIDSKICEIELNSKENVRYRPQKHPKPSAKL